ncbi:MAG: VWA domain-containing protein [Halarcobacter sp.]
MFLIITQKDSFQKHFSEETINKLSVANKHMGKTTRNILFFIALILMTIALARPVANEKDHSFKQEVSSIVIAIDVSKSMLANDIYPNRLAMAKQKLLKIIENSKKNALAVILFAKSSFILSPITQDFNSLKILVENLDTGMNFDNGSNIFSTLETTNKLLKDYKNKNLILLSDGGNSNTYEEEIEYANKNNINIYTIALATKKASAIKLENGEFLTNKDGSIVTVALNENIKKLGLNTNGGYINFSISTDDIKQVLADIDKKSSKKELESKKFKTYTELFYYPLALAIFILLISFSSLPKFSNKLSRKKIIPSLLFLTLLNISTDLKALEFDFQTIEKAKESYKNKEYKKASKNYEKVANTVEAKYNLANSLYKEKKYKEALNQYKEVITSNQDLESKKLHNMGNAYVKLNDLENAKKMYENALKIKADKQTRENLETVQKILDKTKKQKNKKNQEENKDNKEDKKDKKQENKEKEQNKNKEENKDKQDKKNKEDKNKEDKNKDSKKEQEKKKQQEQNKEKSQNKQKTSQQKQEIKPQEISDLEEKKWLEKIQNGKTPVLLKRADTKKEDNSTNPW